MIQYQHLNLYGTIFIDRCWQNAEQQLQKLLFLKNNIVIIKTTHKILPSQENLLKFGMTIISTTSTKLLHQQ